MGKGIPYFLEWVHRYLFKDSAKRRGIYWKECVYRRGTYRLSVGQKLTKIDDAHKRTLRSHGHG